MNNTLKGLHPEKVFKYFEEISDIPRGSGNKKPIADYCVQFAKEHKLQYIRDDYDNVIIDKQASEGYENAPKVIIQGHLDMVAEKTSSSNHNFETDPLKLIVKGDYIYADNTTLGGDDGIAVAYALAVLASDEIMAPAIRAIFTANEEIGLLGATYLNPNLLDARYLLNIDSEVEGVLLNSCAGGQTITLHVPVKRKVCNQYKNCHEIRIDGLLGGHSGTEIDKNRANASKILAKLLIYLGKHAPFDIHYIDGGKKDNAIMPYAGCIISTDMDEKSINDCLQKIICSTKKAYRINDPDLSITCIPSAYNCTPMEDECKNSLISIFSNIPDGVIHYDDIEGKTVQTSCNTGILTMEEDVINVGVLVRSTIDFEKDCVVDSIINLCNNLNIKYTLSGRYPGWLPKENSKLMSVMKSVYESQYYTKPIISGVHAGLECGIFYEKNNSLDIVAFGPDIYDIHTPNEHISIASVERVWYYIIGVLEQFKYI